MELPMGMRNCRCALFRYQNTSTCTAQFLRFLVKADARKWLETRADDIDPACEREIKCKRPVAKLRSLPWKRVWAPQRRSGVRPGLPHRRGVARASSLRVGKGDASLPLLVSPSVTLPLDEDRGLRKIGLRQLVHRFFLNYNNVASELGIMPFRFMFY